MRLFYHLSKPYRQRVFIETGATPDESACVTLPDEALTPAHRAHLVRVLNRLDVPSQFSLSHYHVAGWTTPTVAREADLKVDAPFDDTPETALALFEADMQRWAEAEGQRHAKQIELAQREAERKIADAEREVAEQAHAQAQREAKAQREAEKLAWVHAHGSAFLQQAVSAGYDCQRRYVEERAAHEHPGFVVDWEDRAEWRSRSCPSEAALALALAVGGDVVWLTRAPVDEPEEYWEPGEAVVLRGYLGAYDLVKA